jgi:hypothetical protein
MRSSSRAMKFPLLAMLLSNTDWAGGLDSEILRAR